MTKLDFSAFSNKTVLIACSAGCDSMALLAMFQQAGISVQVCYINHLQRVAENKMELECLQDFCEKHSLPFFSYEISPTNIKAEKNLQAFFRSERYRLLIAHAKKEKITYIATAHHLDDQVETSLMRLTKGYAFTSIHAIAPVREEDGITIVRPLLAFRKKDLQLYCEEEKIAYVEDSSNKKDVYFRNRLRHHVVPILEAENPRAVEAIARHFAENDALYKYVSSEVRTQLQGEIKVSYYDMKVVCFLLQHKPEIIQQIVVNTLIKDCFELNIRLSRLKLLEISQAIQLDKEFKINLSTSISLAQSYGKIYLLDEEHSPIFFEQQIGEGAFEVPVLAGKIEKITNQEKKYSAFDYNIILPCKLLTEELVITSSNADYRLSLKDGHKKLNRLYIDEKVLPPLRNKAVVLKLKNEENIIYDFTTKRLSAEFIATEMFENEPSFRLSWSEK